MYYPDAFTINKGKNRPKKIPIVPIPLKNQSGRGDKSNIQASSMQMLIQE